MATKLEGRGEGLSGLATKKKTVIFLLLALQSREYSMVCYLFILHGVVRLLVKKTAISANFSAIQPDRRVHRILLRGSTGETFNSRDWQVLLWTNIVIL